MMNYECFNSLSCFLAEDGKRNGTFDASRMDSVLDSVNALEEMKDL